MKISNAVAAGLLLGLWMLCLPAMAGAEIMVLVQGYLGGGDSWRSAGIAEQFHQAGWSDGGHLDLRRQHLPVKQQAEPARLFYTLSLPTEAPLMTQQEILGRYLSAIRGQYPHHSLVLVGHSAGGVVSRLYMVKNPDSGVSSLITIASPHLGTDSAELGAAVGRSPLGWVLPLLDGGTVNRSQGLYHDLSRERPQSLLFWLNRQSHPAARYISIVRQDDGLLSGDIVVPSWSQDMNNVMVLRRRADSIATKGGHGLEPADGQLLIRILGQLQKL